MCNRNDTGLLYSTKASLHCHLDSDFFNCSESCDFSLLMDVSEGINNEHGKYILPHPNIRGRFSTLLVHIHQKKKIAAKLESLNGS